LALFVQSHDILYGVSQNIPCTPGDVGGWPIQLEAWLIQSRSVRFCGVGRLHATQDFVTRKYGDGIKVAAPCQPPRFSKDGPTALKVTPAQISERETPSAKLAARSAKKSRSYRAAL